MSNIKPTEEQIIRWKEEFINDRVLVEFANQFARVLELAVPRFTISEKDGNLVSTVIYEAQTLNLLKHIERQRIEYINFHYKHLIDEGYLTVSTKKFDNDYICISSSNEILSMLAQAPKKSDQ